MRRDHEAIKECQAMHFLPGWQASKGANREMKYALELGLDLYRCWWTGAEFHEEPLVPTVPLDCVSPWMPQPASIGGSDTLDPDEGYDGRSDEERKEDSEGGLRLDDGKPRIELVPPSIILAIAEVLGASAEPRGKYPVRNWEKGMAWSKTYAPAMRHLLAWWQGEDLDPESGMPHLWHASTDLAFAVEWARTGTGMDDRPRGK